MATPEEIAVEAEKQAEKQVELLKIRNDLEEASLKNTIELAKAQDTLFEAQQKVLLGEIEKLKLENKAYDDEKQNFQNLTNARKVANATLIEQEKELAKQVANLAKQATDAAKGAEQGQMLAKLLGISENNKDTLVYRLLSNPEEVFAGLKSELGILEGLTTKAAAGTVLVAIGLSALLKVQEATITAFYETDAAFSSFAATTGGAAKYNDVITATARGNTALGISFAQSGKALTDLYQGLNTFTKLNEAAKNSITTTVAKLEKLGISGADSAKSIASLSTAMMVSEESAAKTLETFAAMGESIGVATKQMVSDFIAVKDELFVFGDAMDETFMRLAQQAKATGVAVNDLLGLALKFDTFEGAATQVAKLNSVLGGPYLSAMAMLEATDPTERINMIREAVKESTMSFETMSYYQKKAIMEAGGFKTVEEAKRILSMSSVEAAKAMEAQAASQEKLNEAIKRAQPISEKLSMIMANFAIVMGPVVEGVSRFLSFIVEIMDENPFFSKALVVIAYLFVIIGAAMASFIAPLVAIVAGIGAAIAAFLDLIGVFDKLGFAIMHKRNSPTLYELFKMLPGIFLAMGQAALLFSAAIKITALGLPFLVLGLSGLMLALMSFGNPLTMLGLFAVVGALGAMAIAINQIETEKLISFKVMMEKVVEISMPANTEGFEKFSEKFEAVANATAKIDASKTQTFANMLTATQNLSQSLSLNQTVIVKIGSDKFKGVIEKIIDNKMPDNAISLT